jgi:tetracycline repressor-like protein
VRIGAVSAHQALLRHPWACNPVITPTGTSIATFAARMRYMEWLLGRLRSAGFSDELTYKGYHALDSHIFGFTLWLLGHDIPAQDISNLAGSVMDALPADEFPHLIEHIQQHLEAPSGDGARAFDFGLDLILEGLKQAHTRG